MALNLNSMGISMIHLMRNSRLSLRAAACLLAFLLCAPIASGAHTSQDSKPDDRYVVDYYYKAKWGYADEFISLFKKNHYPLLKRQVETGRIVSVTAVRPRFHATEDGRWDYRVTIVWKNVAASIDSSGEDALIRKLFPDQETFKREEQRRFEILLAHWDVPIVSVDLER
jgi:hypothetical protein